MELSRGIFEAKRAIGMRIEDEGQEKVVLDRAVDMATEMNLDAGSVKNIFEIIIGMSRQKQYGYKENIM